MGDKVVTKSILFWLLITVLLTPGAGAEAQQAGKMYRIGYLRVGPVDEAFRQRLSELGYIEGKNITIELRIAKRVEQFPRPCSRAGPSQSGLHSRRGDSGDPRRQKRH